MLEKQRQQLILDILDEKQFASVRSLSPQLGASEATIRRDITKMAASGHFEFFFPGHSKFDIICFKPFLT